MSDRDYLTQMTTSFLPAVGDAIYGKLLDIADSRYFTPTIPQDSPAFAKLQKDVAKVNRLPPLRVNKGVANVNRPQPLKVNVKYGNPGFDSAQPGQRATVFTNTDCRATLSHELGHAANDKTLKSWFGRHWLGPSNQSGKALKAFNVIDRIHSPIALSAAPAYVALNNVYPDLKPDGWTARGFTYGPLFSSLPVLAEEASASIRGLRRFGKPLGATRRGKLGLLAAFGSYAAPAVANMLAMLKIRDIQRQKNASAQPWWLGPLGRTVLGSRVSL